MLRPKDNLLWLYVLIWLASQTAVASNCKQITLQQSIDTESLWRDLAVLASDEMQGRRSGTPGNLKAREYLVQRYQQLGLKSFPGLDQFKQPFAFERWGPDTTGVNLVGWLQGHAHPEHFIVISAHYDHIGHRGSKIFNGADDNASGVAAMLAIAAALQQEPPAHSVIFLATDAEEKGLIGARAFVENPPVELQAIRFNLNLDMVAQGGRKHQLLVYGGRKHPELAHIVSTVIDQAGICVKKGRKAKGYGFSAARRINWTQASDHGAFHKVKIPFLFVGVNEHPQYHTENDEIDTIPERFFFGATETSLMLFRKMDGL